MPCDVRPSEAADKVGRPDLSQLPERSAWSNAVNLRAAMVLQLFFATSVVAYVVHGALGDTDNQFRRPPRWGKLTIPSFAMTTFMLVLIAAEVSAFGVVFSGYLLVAVNATQTVTGNG